MKQDKIFRRKRLSTGANFVHVYLEICDKGILKFNKFHIQSTLVISNSKGLSETLRDIRTSTYQCCGSEEKNKSNNHI